MCFLVFLDNRVLAWSRGMISALDAGGLGFKFLSQPIVCFELKRNGAMHECIGFWRQSTIFNITLPS